MSSLEMHVHQMAQEYISLVCMSPYYYLQLEPTDFEEMHGVDIDFEASEDADSEEEREKDKATDFIDAAHDMGILGEPSDPSNTLKIDDKEANDLKDLLISLTMINTANKLLASGTEKLRDIITRVPSLQKMSILLGSIQHTDPDLLALANLRSKTPVSSGRSMPKYLRPHQSEGGKFKCVICQIIFGSWTGCDSHIRSTHTHIKYGPCRKCNDYSNTNYDSFKKHEKNCEVVILN